MKLLKIYTGNINERHIGEAVEALREGHIVIYPTDTVYGMAVDALNKKAVERLCRVKGLNPDKNLMSIVCSDLSQASEYVRIDNAAFSIIKDYLPGPYTFVLPASTRLPKIFKGRKTVGLRIPDNDIARALADGLGGPLLTGSVDIDEDAIENTTDPECLALVYADVADIVIDGGEGGLIPSTVVDLTDPSEPEVLRQGIAEF